MHRGRVRFENRLALVDRRDIMYRSTCLRNCLFGQDNQKINSSRLEGGVMLKKLNQILNIVIGAFVGVFSGYIGSSTRSEMEYTKAARKPVRYLVEMLRDF